MCITQRHLNIKTWDTVFTSLAFLPSLDSHQGTGPCFHGATGLSWSHRPHVALCPVQSSLGVMETWLQPLPQPRDMGHVFESPQAGYCAQGQQHAAAFSKRPNRSVAGFLRSG